MKSRVAEVNRVLKAQGKEERLTRGRGYYYFRDGNTAFWPATAVNVYRADELTVERWLQEYGWLAAAAR